MRCLSRLLEAAGCWINLRVGNVFLLVRYIEGTYDFQPIMGLGVISRHVNILFLFTDPLFCLCSLQGSYKTWVLFVIAEFAKVTRCVIENMLINWEESYFFSS